MKPYYDHNGITIYHGDCREILPTLAEGSVDLVLTDPPYGIAVGAAFVHARRVHNGSGTFNETEGPYDWLACCFPTLLIPGGHAAVFVNRATEHKAVLAIESTGLRLWHKFYLVKKAPPPTPRPLFVSAVETCLIAELRCGKRRWFGTGYEPNCWIGLTPSRLGNGVHPAEKPLSPIRRIVRCLTPLCGFVLDPFMGSGTTLRAAKDLGHRAIGIEIEERYCEIAAKRLAQEVLAFEQVQG